MSVKIGIDFDNTIIDYNSVFHKYALKYGIISPNIKKYKKSIRDYIKENFSDGNNKWIELQCEIYGKRINEAIPAEGVIDFFNKCKNNSFKIVIISHKTIYPLKGSMINLRHAAEKWLKKNNFFSIFNIEIKFSDTREDKLYKIREENCSYFIDDMIEIFLNNNFPLNTKKILYSPEEEDNIPSEIRQFKNWNEIGDYFFESR